MSADTHEEDCETAVELSDELQWRQVHPQFVDGDLVSQEAFVGTPGSTDEVSTVRSAKRTAKQAYRHYTETLDLKSQGTWAVSVSEVHEVDCAVVDDSACDGVDTPGHSFVDMRDMTKAARRVARATLATAATARGCQHSP